MTFIPFHFEVGAVIRLGGSKHPTDWTVEEKTDTGYRLQDQAGASKLITYNEILKFIDEGFGSLDAETLDLAIDALETLQSRGQNVGVITHVAAMIERIAVQVRVEKRGAGRSKVRVSDGT